ncbi:DUF6777 domain-containing protein [Actinomycetospora succinea]
MPPAFPGPPPPRRASRGPIIAIVVLAMLVAALGGVIVARELNAPTDVTLEPVATAGANPFMESVGTDVPDVRPVAHTGGTYSGTTPGLYGGSGSNSVCDRSRLSRFLGEHPDRAAGWASVLGLRDSSASTISSYVDGLTSVVLRSDTYVTNHGWSGGHVTAWPSVLQAGTAVLVDQHGNLVTRCFCGNPLTAPQSFTTVAYVGPRWYSFQSTSITVVTHQTTQVTNNFTIIDVHTGRGHDRPHGTEGEHDRPNPRVQANFPEGQGPEENSDAAAPLAAGDTSTTTPTGPTSNGAPDEVVAEQPADPAAPEDEGAAPGAVQQRSIPSGGTGLAPRTTSSSTTTPPSSSTTTSATSSGSEPSGDYTAGSGCQFATGTLTFTSTGTYSSDANDAGTWEMSGSSLVVTPTGGGSSVTFTGSTSLWTSPSGSCTLTAAS